MQFSQSSCEKSLTRNSASLLLNDIIIPGNGGTGRLYPRNRGSGTGTGCHSSLHLSLAVTDACLFSLPLPVCPEEEEAVIDLYQWGGGS